MENIDENRQADWMAAQKRAVPLRRSASDLLSNNSLALEHYFVSGNL
jgi:hypothetical protein